MTWCGYIDVLGTREAAALGLSDVRAHLRHFHSALYDNFEAFTEGRCIAASDGAFFETSGINNFYPYYRRVRNTLFERGIFLKCSFVAGGIRFEEKQKINGDGAVVFKSLEFSDQASLAFQTESSLKGIGCWIKVTEARPENTVVNFMVVKESGRFTVEKFEDFSFSRYEVGAPESREGAGWKTEAKLVDSIFYHCHYALVNSDNFAVKYVPLFVNAIRSSDFRDLSYENGSWQNAPYILRKLLASKSTTGAILRIPGAKFILLSLYDEYYAQNFGELKKSAEEQVLQLLLARADCTTNLNSVPDFVLRPEARTHLLEAISRVRGIERGSSFGRA